MALCLWNSKVTTPFPSPAATAAGLGGGEAAGGEAGGDVDGGTGFTGAGATGLLKGPSAWELLMVNLKVEEEEEGEYEEHDDGVEDEGFGSLMHENEGDDEATDIFLFLP